MEGSPKSKEVDPGGGGMGNRVEAPGNLTVPMATWKGPVWWQRRMVPGRGHSRVKDKSRQMLAVLGEQTGVLRT